MRNIILGLTVLLAATGVRAQAPPKLECRDMAQTGNFINANETVVNGMACHTIDEKPVVAQVAASPETAAQPAAVASDSQQATVYFYRPRRFQGSALRPTVFVDDARAGRLHNGDSIKVSLAPGDHKIYSSDKSTGMELNAKPGETYYVRIDIQVGMWKGHGGVTLVDPQQGKYEVGQAAHQGADDN